MQIGLGDIFHSLDESSFDISWYLITVVLYKQRKKMETLKKPLFLLLFVRRHDPNVCNIQMHTKFGRLGGNRFNEAVSSFLPEVPGCVLLQAVFS